MDKLKTVLPVLLVVLLGYAEARRSKRIYTVEINESGTHFNESVEVNKRENTVLYKVPAHNDVDQSEVLFDYQSGYFATRIPKLKECFIQRIPKDQSSPEQVRKSLQLQHAMMKGNKSKILVNTIVVATVKERKIEPTELNARFLTFCGDYEVYEVKKIETNEKIRQKRFVKALTKEEIIAMGIDVWVGSNGEWKELTFNTCKPLRKYWPDLKKGGCGVKPDDWEFHCGAKTKTCIYFVKCKRGNQRQVICLEEHFFTGWTCCKVQCP